jgi:NAD(P)H-hydrate epimerase
MTNLVTSHAAVALDAETRASWKLDDGILMESAAARLWFALRPLLDSLGRGEPTLVAAIGTGNNGGDALALLRHARFSAPYPMCALVVAEHLGNLATKQAASLRAGGIEVLPSTCEEGKRRLSEADVVIDGLAGTGIGGEPRKETAALIKTINALGKKVASIDLPSGLQDSMKEEYPHIDATWTLSIEPRKVSLYYPAFRSSAGRIIPVQGVFPFDSSHPVAARLLDIEDLALSKPIIAPHMHKGQRGRLAIFAGSPGMMGAAFLSARAAHAAGAGLICLFVHKGSFQSLLAGPGIDALGGVIVKKESDFQAETSRFDAILAGPGWGQDVDRTPILRRLFDCELPLVLDADAIRILPRIGIRPRTAPLLMTPHPGEFSTLAGIPLELGLSDPLGQLSIASATWGATILLKSATSWIYGDGALPEVLDGREAGLGVAGSGDVLAGLAGGLLAGLYARASSSEGDRPRIALRVAALVHLISGRQARSETGWFEAGELVDRSARLLGSP